MSTELTEQDKVSIGNPDDLYGIMQRILLRENKIDRDKEHFWIVGMDNAGMILYIELVSLGSFKATLIEPMNVFRVAVLKNANQVIGIHNHPSCLLKPSQEDINITDRLIQSGKILSIDFIDHLIIDTENYISFKKMGLMDELTGSLKYVPPYKISDMLREMEDSKKNTVISLAKRNIPIEEISVITNLRVDEISEILVNSK